MNKLIKELDAADVFLRNRANAKPAPLNEYDVETMIDIAKVCDEAARALERAIVPPCKVGDMVYCIIEGFEEVMEGHIRQLIVSEEIFVDCVIRGYFNQVFHSSKIGKTVFFSREEAVQALKGGAE